MAIVSCDHLLQSQDSAMFMWYNQQNANWSSVSQAFLGCIIWSLISNTKPCLPQDSTPACLLQC